MLIGKRNLKIRKSAPVDFSGIVWKALLFKVIMMWDNSSCLAVTEEECG